MIIGFGDYLNVLFLLIRRKKEKEWCVFDAMINKNKKIDLELLNHIEVEKLGIPRKFLSDFPRYAQLIQMKYIYKLIYTRT